MGVAEQITRSLEAKAAGEAVVQQRDRNATDGRRERELGRQLVFSDQAAHIEPAERLAEMH